MDQELPSIKDFLKRGPAMIMISVFVVFASSEVYANVRNPGQDSLANIITFLILLVLPFLIWMTLYWFYWQEKVKIELFEAWLKANVHELERKSAISYHGYVISKDTKLVEYFTVISIILFTFNNSTGVMPEDFIGRRSFAVFSTIMTFVFGWWGFPWGPIRTISALIHNFRGGKKYTVDSYFSSKKKKRKFVE